ncbi:multidrug ABC transporter permease [Rhodococcus opacus RKJ300 = JCM 13270]|uniref:Transport permease protein n=1 Tax=Rhodococcus opacus RKJ300 = JCM 13270 TaxID=1165867 RepID=I0WYN5_RHOOP|nr:ABC transporter permease [Rhodococcus opacus]EID81501.1 multidrug ABC transporter permease [Rhodococcus opacus RKJ300 = JCM 13270]
MTTIRTTAERSPIGDQLAALTVRNLRTSSRVPQLLMFSLTMPMAMLVLFSQVFRSVAAGPGFPAGVSYIVFLTPAMLAVSTVMAGTNAGVSAAIDHTNGVHDRFAALPMRAALPGVARTINEAVFTLARAALLGIAAVALGFEFHGTAGDAVAAVIVLVVLAGAMSALFGLIGDRLRRPDVVQFAGMMVMMPLMFVSSAFAPIETMPGWMQAMATGNPVAPATDALRGHVLGTATAGDTAAALVAAIGLWAVVTAVPVLTRLVRAARTR